MSFVYIKNPCITPMMFLALVSCDIFTNISHINTNFNFNNIELATQEIIDLYSKDKTAIVTETYCTIMLKTGKYDMLLGTPMEEKATHLKTLKEDIETNILTLYEHSPCDIHILEAYVREMLKKKVYKKAYEAISKAKMNRKNEATVKNLDMQYNLIKGNFSMIELNHAYSNRVKPYYDEFKNCKGQCGYSLNKLYDDVDKCAKSDAVVPSIFLGLKYEILKTILSDGVERQSKGLTSKATEMLILRNDDLSKYTLIACKIYDGANVTQLMDFYTFKDNYYKKNLENKIKTYEMNRIKKQREEEEKKEQLKREKEQKERQKKQQEQRERQQQEQRERSRYNRNHQYSQHNTGRNSENSDDPSGYYKVLGLPKTSTKTEIKRRYYKMIREKNPDKLAGNDEKKFKELNDELMKINEAKEVLLDDKKRDLYDRGMYGANNKQHYAFQDEGFSDIFQAFFGGGGGGNSGFSRGGSGGRTFYFSTGGF